jgi:type II secretory pathway pseudopilin PulG
MKLTFSGSSRLARAGSTLVEVVMSTSILGICAGGIMGAFASGFMTTELTRENQRATQILIEKTETIRLYSWDQINTPGFIPTTFTERYDPRQDLGVTYTGSVSITEPPLTASYTGQLRLLTITLEWSTRDIPRRRSFSTLIAKDGLQNYVY